MPCERPSPDTPAMLRAALAEPGVRSLAAFVACLGRERESLGGDDD